MTSESEAAAPACADADGTHAGLLPRRALRTAGGRLRLGDAGTTASAGGTSAESGLLSLFVLLYPRSPGLPPWLRGPSAVMALGRLWNKKMPFNDQTDVAGLSESHPIAPSARAFPG